MPFVFAVWTARGDVELGELPERLRRAKELGLANLESIVTDHAARHGWPKELARQYLGDHLKYDVGTAQLEAIEMFHRMAFEEGLISALKPLVVAR
jgi:predicted solute-binding protein